VGARRFLGERERGVRAEGGAAEGEMERRKMRDRGILGAGGGRADAKQNDVPFFYLKFILFSSRENTS
jgi:hypothetical protein